MVRVPSNGTEVPVRIYNTHITTTSDVYRQIGVVANMTQASGIARKVVLGDFQRPSFGDATFNSFKNLGFRNVAISDTTPFTTASAKRDYILISGPITWSQLMAPSVSWISSDHWPFSAELG